MGSGLELKKKKCFMKKLDNKCPMLGAKHEYNHDVIISVSDFMI